MSDLPLIRRPARPGQLRASDAERETVIDRLRIHAGDGRLTPEELEERIDEAYAARTRGQLAEVLRELPAVARPPDGPSGSARRRRSPARRLVPMALVLVALVAAAGGPGEGWAERERYGYFPEVERAATRAAGGGVARDVERTRSGGWEVEVEAYGDEIEVTLDRNLDVVELDRD